MKICFPARKANGDNYATVDDMMKLLLQEPHGSWLAGTNNMWHGGIHITSESAPGSVLTNETADTAIPLQFMAGGEVVAWRVNKDYLASTYMNKPLQYSSTFVLVKSTCTPDPEKKDNSLDFYSLYIGLAPLSAFAKHKLYQVTEKGDGLHKRVYNGKEKAGDVAPVAERHKLKTGDSVIVLRETTFDLKGQTQTFGLARALNSKSEMTGNAFWMSLDPQYVAPVGEQMAHLPAWMQQAVAQGAFDAAVIPATKLDVAAGDAVGYLAEDIAPDSMGGVEKSAFVHVEVLSTDSRMSDFLSNKAQAKSGPKYVHIHPESSVYARSGDTFTQTKGKVKKDIHKIMPQDKCHPFTDKGGKRWFDIGDGAWLNEADVDADINQYDLMKLGFSTFEEPSTSDMTKSLSEGWIKDGFTKIAEWVRPERGIQEKQVSHYYKALLRKMDSDNSGDLSGEELRHAVHFPAMDVRDIAARMVVKHDSEWFGGSSHHRWKTFLKQLDPLCVNYVKQWFDDMEWMSKVDGFSSGAPVWHMHPIVFLDALKTEDECAKLIWGDVVNQRLGQDKACLFRKKVVKICSELWGEERKLEFANSLMACMAVETSRLFSSSVVKLMPKVNSQGVVILNSKGRPVREYRPITKQELNANPSIASRSAVGLIQFTGPAVAQLNKTHGLSITKQQLALMDEIEQLDYVKLYFTSNKKLFNKIKTGDDIYLYIFCPAGVGRDDGFALYSRQKDKDEDVNYYQANSSLDSNQHGNLGNNDGVIQRGELLSRLNKLRDEGRKYVNKCLCYPDAISVSKEPSGSQWVRRFETSSNISDLSPEFSTAVNNFTRSIIDAGGHVRVSATYRPVERAYLMHYAWKIAREGMRPSSVPAKDGVNIDWTHKGNDNAAFAAAQDMVNGYHIVYGPVLSSRHTQRRAIDMTITGVIGKYLKNASGNNVLVSSQSKLHEVGASFGVHKLLSDPPHWSDDGH
ncbi:hypothetical protein WH357_18675 [Enterobacter ludwigii]